MVIGVQAEAGDNRLGRQLRQADARAARQPVRRLRAGGPRLDKGLRTGSGLVDRARAAFWEQSEKFSDLIAEIRE